MPILKTALILTITDARGNVRAKRALMLIVSIPAALLALLICAPAVGQTLLTERFDKPVADLSAIGQVQGWHAYALHGGKVLDYTASTPGAFFPSLSYAGLGAGAGGVGYLVMGSGNTVSNVLVWTDCQVPQTLRSNVAVHFYSKSEGSEGRHRIVVRVDTRWYASAEPLLPGFGAWTLHRFPLDQSSEGGAWFLLETNRLALGTIPVEVLPEGTITAVGFFGELQPDQSKIRIDEVQLTSGSSAPSALEPGGTKTASYPQSMDPNYLVGQWIWAEETARQQTCRFWRLIEVPRGTRIVRARVRMTADNSYRAFIDGDEFGRGAYWQRLAEYDIASALTPGKHVLAVEAFNDEGPAGFAAGVLAEFEGGRVMAIPSDRNWRVVPNSERNWIKRTVPSESWTFAKASFAFRDWPGLQGDLRVYSQPPFNPPVLALWQKRWFQTALLSFCGLAVLVCIRLLAQIALQSKAREVLQRERARIARDIHDDFGAVLTQLVLLGETAQTEAGTGAETRAKFARVSDTGRRLLRSIDEVVWLVNSQRDSLRDFETYVCRYTENFLRSSSVRCRINTDTEVPDAAFDLAARRSFFLAIKEALNNAVRHGTPAEVVLSIHMEKEMVRVTIEDNGKGFELSGRDTTRNGISNMSQRLKEIGGDCIINSSPGKGTRVELIAPISRSPAKGAWKLLKRTRSGVNVDPSSKGRL